MQRIRAELNSKLISDGKMHRLRKASLSSSEVATIIILFHKIGYRCFKHFYEKNVCARFRRKFPKLPSYNRFLELIPRCAEILSGLFNKLKGKCYGISIITPLLLLFAITYASKDTKHLKVYQKEVKRLPDGFLDLNFM